MSAGVYRSASTNRPATWAKHKDTQMSAIAFNRSAPGRTVRLASLLADTFGLPMSEAAYRAGLIRKATAAMRPDPAPERIRQCPRIDPFSAIDSPRPYTASDRKAAVAARVAKVRKAVAEGRKSPADLKAAEAKAAETIRREEARADMLRGGAAAYEAMLAREARKVKAAEAEAAIAAAAPAIKYRASRFPAARFLDIPATARTLGAAIAAGLLPRLANIGRKAWRNRISRGGGVPMGDDADTAQLVAAMILSRWQREAVGQLRAGEIPLAYHRTKAGGRITIGLLAAMMGSSLARSALKAAGQRRNSANRAVRTGRWGRPPVAGTGTFIETAIAYNYTPPIAGGTDDAATILADIETTLGSTAAAIVRAKMIAAAAGRNRTIAELAAEVGVAASTVHGLLEKVKAKYAETLA